MREALWSGDGARGQAGTRRLSDGLGDDARGQADSDDARELSDGLGGGARGQADTGGGCVDTADDFVQEETV